MDNIYKLLAQETMSHLSPDFVEKLYYYLVKTYPKNYELFDIDWIGTKLNPSNDMYFFHEYRYEGYTIVNKHWNISIAFYCDANICYLKEPTVRLVKKNRDEKKVMNEDIFISSLLIKIRHGVSQYKLSAKYKYDKSALTKSLKRRMMYKSKYIEYNGNYFVSYPTEILSPIINYLNYLGKNLKKEYSNNASFLICPIEKRMYDQYWKYRIDYIMPTDNYTRAGVEFYCDNGFHVGHKANKKGLHRLTFKSGFEQILIEFSKLSTDYYSREILA